jgi:OOP family OmpA-OmpF porin
VIFSLNALDFYRGNPKWDWYGFVGYAMVNSDIDTRLALGGSGATPFNFTTVNYNGSKDDIQTAVNNLLSQAATGGSKENFTNAPVRAKRDDITSGNFLRNHALTAGAGFSYKLSPGINIGFEDRVVNPFSGDLDAINTGSNDIMQLCFTVRLNFNLGSKAKSVDTFVVAEPAELHLQRTECATSHEIAKLVLPDGDGDGVTDQFDLEPNTPSGCPVDSHGVSKDTDGDGVPDCRDKEVLTLLKCFPVNS